MEKITWVGPSSTATVEKSDIKKFDKFLSWLIEYNPSEHCDLDHYSIKTDNRLIASKIKARKMGFIVN